MSYCSALSYKTILRTICLTAQLLVIKTILRTICLTAQLLVIKPYLERYVLLLGS